MIKIIPVILLPLFFFLFYSNVSFLTNQISKKNNQSQNKINDQSDLIANNGSEVKKSNIYNSNQNNEKLTSTDDQTLKKQTKIVNDNQTLEEKNLEEKSNLKKNSTSKGQIGKKIHVQFGAFKDNKNAEKLRDRLKKIFEREFGPNYTGFEIISINEHSKLIFKADSVLSANNLCKFSKKKNISCLVLNE